MMGTTLVHVAHEGRTTTYTNQATGLRVRVYGISEGYVITWRATGAAQRHVEFRQSRADAVTLALDVAHGEEK